MMIDGADVGDVAGVLNGFGMSYQPILFYKLIMYHQHLLSS
jgi:hypothetical protein